MLLKFFAVGVMARQIDAMSEVKIYFCHLHSPRCPSGYADQTMSGRIISGDVGGSMPGSSVPKGVEMSDLEYLQSINRMDCALVALKSHDLSHGTRLWDYIHARYRLRLKLSDLMLCFGISKRTCLNWQSEALGFIYNKIC